MPQLPPTPANDRNSKRIRLILADIPHKIFQGDPASVISGVRQDSRQINPGDLFVALPGFTVDGHQFLEDAIGNGASALIVQEDRRQTWQPIADAHPNVSVISVDDTRAALPEIASAFHDHPAQRLTVIGVTGTDGKSTTSYLTHAMLSAAGHSVGLISGVEFQIGGHWITNETGETTPEADVVQALLAEMVAAGDTHVVIEATSHALALHRVDHCNFHTAVFTGLSSDHLDFHKTQEAYLDAKLHLIRSVDSHLSPRYAGGDVPKGQRGIRPPPTAIVRAEDPHRTQVTAAHHQRTITATATDESADIAFQPVASDATGTNIRLCTPSGALAARLPLPGDFNLGNAALAAAAAWIHGAGPVALQRALNNLRPVPGRMESIETGQPFSVLVDAAATGPALDLALRALKPHVSGNLILVFGVAGERDPARRSGMAQAAAELADYSLITSENPRSEEPAAIVREIADAMRAHGAGDRLHEEPDRRRAIQLAFERAAPDDLVLIAGKGAEPTLIYADRTEPWDDRRVARELLVAYAG